MARRSVAEAPADINVTTNSSFVLAADRTYRRDPLNGFRKYPGGWNISEVHYFAVSHQFRKLQLYCLLTSVGIILILISLLVVRRIYSHSAVRHCSRVVCDLFPGYAWDLLPSLLLPASHLQVFTNSICSIIDTSNTVHMCCNVSSILLL